MISGPTNRLHGRPRDTSFNRWNLCFRDPLVERQFHQSYVGQSQVLNRGYMLLGILAYLLYSVLDFMVLSSDLHLVLVVRMSISAVLAALIAATYWRRNYRDLQLILSACVVFAGGGIISAGTTTSGSSRTTSGVACAT